MYLQENEWDLALEELKRAVEKYPNNEEAQFLLGFVHGQNASYREMAKRFDISLGISDRFESEIQGERSRHWKENYNKGIKALDADHFELAEQHLKAAMIIDSTRDEAARQLATTYLHDQRPKEALEIYRDLLKIYPQDVQLLLSVAEVHYRQGHLNEQIDYLRRIIAIAPNHRDALSNLAASLDVLEQSAKAEQVYQKAVTHFPLDRELISRFGVHHFKRGNYEKAIELFERVLDLNSEDLEAISNIGNAYLSLAENLRKQLKKSTNGSRRTADVQEMRDRAILNYKRAIPYLHKALEIDPNLAGLWRNLGVAYIQTGQKQKGQEAFLRAEAFDINPN